MRTEYDTAAAFAAIEDELIASMMRNLQRHRAEETKEGIQWSQWQAEMLDGLEEYKRSAAKRYGTRFQSINSKLEAEIRSAYAQGGADQEATILDAIRSGFSARSRADTLGGSFFRVNERKLDALIKATTHDMEQAETAVLRRANDQYRKIIYNAQVYANTGAGTYEKAVDMATKDFLSAGIQCVVYKNGARHTLSDYADMALRTASKRAYLQGEGDKRQEWGVSTVIINKRSGACPDCAKFCGKVFIDDVWSGGSSKDGDYPLLSSAIAQGLYHPRCKDSHSTWFPELHEDEKPYTKAEIAQLEQNEQREQREQYAQRQAEKYRRLEKYSLDPENKQKYAARAEEWSAEANRQEEQQAAALGVKADYSGWNPELSKLVNQSIAEVQEMFGPLTHLKGVRKYTGTSEGYAMFHTVENTIYLKNVGAADILKQMAEDAKLQSQFGGWSTDSPRHAIVHEIGHAVAKQYLTAEKRAELERLRRAEVSRVTGSADTDIRAEATRKNSTAPIDEWGKKAKSDLGLYGIVSVEEMISESLAQNILGNPGTLAQNVIWILMG